ncbi:MAG: zinc ribbon domain-containing protein [Tyzzerella sp.]|nr:zinc ribbon domain-containing protein [Tyzzerella sp.]
MFCSKCGKEIPENTNFCSHCGTQQGNSVSVKMSEKKNERKKNPKNVILSLVVVLAVYLLGRFAIAPAMLSDKDGNAGSNNQSDLSSTQNNMENDENTVADNSAYTDIFMSRNIVDMSSIFTTMDTAAFANVSEEGTVEKLEYAYEDDTVKEFVDVVYYEVADMTEDQKIALDNTMKNNCASMEETDFCTVSYNMGNNYYSVTLHFKDLDKTENIQKLYDFGMLVGEGVSKISMSETESNLLSGGYVKK